MTTDNIPESKNCPFCGSKERVKLNTYCKWLCSNCDNAYGKLNPKN